MIMQCPFANRQMRDSSHKRITAIEQHPSINRGNEVLHKQRQPIRALRGSSPEYHGPVFHETLRRLTIRQGGFYHAKSDSRNGEIP